MNFAIFSDSFGWIMKKSSMETYHFACYAKEILLSSLHKKKIREIKTEFLHLL